MIINRFHFHIPFLMDDLHRLLIKRLSIQYSSSNSVSVQISASVAGLVLEWVTQLLIIIIIQSLNEWQIRCSSVQLNIPALWNYHPAWAVQTWGHQQHYIMHKISAASLATNISCINHTTKCCTDLNQTRPRTALTFSRCEALYNEHCSTCQAQHASPTQLPIVHVNLPPSLFVK